MCGADAIVRGHDGKRPASSEAGAQTVRSESNLKHVPTLCVIDHGHVNSIRRGFFLCGADIPVRQASSACPILNRALGDLGWEVDFRVERE